MHLFALRVVPLSQHLKDHAPRGTVHIHHVTRVSKLQSQLDLLHLSQTQVECVAACRICVIDGPPRVDSNGDLCDGGGVDGGGTIDSNVFADPTAERGGEVEVVGSGDVCSEGSGENP